MHFLQVYPAVLLDPFILLETPCFVDRWIISSIYVGLLAFFCTNSINIRAINGLEVGQTAATLYTCIRI